MEQETTRSDFKRYLLEKRQVMVDRIAKAQEEIAEAQKEIEAYERVFSGLGSEAEWPQSEVDSPQERPTRPPRRPRTPRKGTLQDRVQIAAYKILKESGGPLKRKELTDRVIASGVPMNAVNPPKQLGKILKLDPRFQNSGGGLWSLVEQESQLQEVEQESGEEASRRSKTVQATIFGATSINN